MLDLIRLRVAQMQVALGQLSEYDLSQVRSSVVVTDTEISTVVDFRSPSLVELHNAASSVIENIARLKDHFKAWLKTNGMASKRAEDFISSTRPAAIIHDLWNVEKHVTLNQPPRSGFTPRLVIHGMPLKIGGAPGLSAVVFALDSHTGTMVPKCTGNVRRALDADVLDEHGSVIYDFERLCTEAVDAWHAELVAAGVAL